MGKSRVCCETTPCLLDQLVTGRHTHADCLVSCWEAHPHWQVGLWSTVAASWFVVVPNIIRQHPMTYLPI